MQPLSKTKLRLFRSLHSKKQRYKQGMFIVEGIKMVQEVHRAKWQLVCVIIREDALQKYESTINLFPESIRFQTSPDNFLHISSQENPEGIVAVVYLPKHLDPAQHQSMALPDGPGFILDRIQDPGNVGTILRIAHWFGFRSVICLEGTADVLNAKTLRSSMGALFFVNVMYSTLSQIGEQINTQQLWIADLGGNSLESVQFGAEDYFVLGNEAQGVDPYIFSLNQDRMIHIPGTQGAESLNVAVAAGIIAYVFSTRQSQV